MGRILKYVFLLILGYLLLIHFTGFSKDVAAGGKLAVGSIKALQGR